MNKTLIDSMVVLVIVLLVAAILGNNRIENFSDDQEVPLKSINICGRNIVFPYFSRNAFTASQRSMERPVVTGQMYPAPVCDISTTNGIVNESHSIVHENSLFYNLRHMCLAFRVKSSSESTIKSQILRGNHLQLVFSTSTPDDVENLKRLFLLNPLYVEFMIPHSTNVQRSTAYMFPRNKPTYFTNVNGIKPYTNDIILTFEDLASVVNLSTNGARQKCDNAFNYLELALNQRALNSDDVRTFTTEGVVHLKAYYLDEMPSSFQYIGRSIKLDKTKNPCTIYNTGYQQYFNNNYATQLYEFMNNIFLMYSNYVYPVFTFNFTINVSKKTNLQLMGNRYVVWKVIMNTGATYRSCPTVTDISGGPNVNNILSMAIEGSTKKPDEFVAHFFSGVSQTCGFDHANKISITLPLFEEDNKIKISVTVSPNEKVVLATWNVLGDIYPFQFVFNKQKDCTSSSSFYDVCKDTYQKTNIVSNFLDLFTDKKMTSRPTIGDILMYYNSSIVPDVESCALGYINLYEKATAFST